LTVTGVVHLLAQTEVLQGPNATTLMIFRWVHFLAGITWIGLLYFFNLVNVDFMRGLDAETRARVLPPLLSRALWWFRWSSLVTVLAGLAYWMNIVSSDARNAQVRGGHAIWTFFLIWTVAFALENGLVTPLKGPFNNTWVVCILALIIAGIAGWLYVNTNSHGWESNRLLAIGVGGGMGWFLMLNVWGIVWRNNKKIIRWTGEHVANGTPVPEKAQKLARQAYLVSRISAWLTIPLLFFMGAASHYPLLGK
jgi:uncharacterized membrane protein